MLASSMKRACAYEALSKSQAYRRLNEHLLDVAPPVARGRIADLGCGTGSLTQLVIERAPDAEVWAIDPDPPMLASARALLNGRATLLDGKAEDLPALLPGIRLDLVLLGNCIHLIDDIDRLMEALRASVRPAGRVAFNSAFAEGADDPADRPLYWELILKARGYARDRGARTDRAVRPLAKRVLNGKTYRDALKAVGFEVTYEDFEWIHLDKALVLQVLDSPLFAAGALPGVPADIASEALGQAWNEIASRRGEISVRRRWLYMVAENRCAATGAMR
jgi:SAM-dependent methyltransferase